MPDARSASLVAAALMAAAATGQTPYTPARVVAVGQNGITSVGNNHETAPAIDSAGRVAFVASTAASVGVYRGDGPTVTAIDVSPTTWAEYSGLSVNAAGAVMFHHTPDALAGFSRIAAGSGGPLTVHADGGATGPYRSLGYRPAGNAAGEAAFFGRTEAAGFAVFKSNGTGPAAVVASVGPVFSLVGGGFAAPAGADNPALNDAGAVAFLATSTVSGRLGLYVATGGGFSRRAEAGGGLDAFNSPVINNLGTVAFAAARTGGGAGLYRVDAAGNRTTVAETGPVFNWFGEPGAGIGPLGPALNNDDRVAFLAGLTAGGEGIFTGPDPLADKVIRTGDLLDGSAVTDLGFGRFGLNDAGQVTFWAALADGRSGIYTLTPVPEPAGLLGAVALALAGWRARAGRVC